MNACGFRGVVIMGGMKLECPECKRPIANRRIETCMYCEAKIPKELLLTKEETEKLDSVLEKDKVRHEAFMRRSSNNSNGGGFIDGFGGGDFGDFDGGDI